MIENDVSPTIPGITTPTSGSTISGSQIIAGSCGTSGDIITISGSALTSNPTTGTCGAGGTFSIQLTLTGNGSIVLTASSADIYGNLSTGSTEVTVTLDTTNPVAPQINAPTSSSYSTTGNVTISGTGEANGTFSIYSGGQLVVTGTIDSAGYWTGYLTGLADQQYTLTGDVTDGAGNVGSTSTAISFTVDTTAPAAPQVNTPTNGSYSTTGNVQVTGTGEAGGTYSIYSGGTLIQTGTIDASGYWTGYFTGLADQQYTLTGTVTDVAGNEGAASTAISFTVDTLAPSAPQINSPTAGSYSTTGNVQVTGTGEAGSTWSLYSGGTLIQTGTIDASGYWTGYFTGLADQQYTLTGTVTDPAGNVGAASTVISFTVDTTVPAAPQINTPTSGSYSTTGNIQVTGTGEAGGTYSIYSGGTLIQTGTIDSAGYWTGYFTGLADQAYTLSGTVTDPAGNVSVGSTAITVTVDTTAPAAPQINSPTTGAQLTTGNVTLVGTGEAGGTYTVSSGGTVILTGTIDAAGYWTGYFTGLADQTYTFSVTVTDVAGNTGSADTVQFGIDTVPPVAPGISSPTTGSYSTTGNVTVTGTGEAGGTFSIYSGGTLLITGTVDSAGYWTGYLTGLADASYTLSGTVTDSFGQEGPSTEVSFIVDSTAPVAPGIVTPAAGGTESTNTITFSGTGEAN